MVVGTPPGPGPGTDPTLEAWFERVRAVRWLEPDAGMATLDAAAQRFLEERADEHRAAVRAAGGPAGSSPVLAADAALPLRVTRSLPEARDASAHASEAAALRDFAPSAVLWVTALEHARAAALRDARDRVGAAVCAQVAARTWEVVRALPGVGPSPGQPDPPGYGGFPTDIAHGAPGGEALVAHAWWLLAYGAARADESPWAPLVALWERGTCPLATPDGALLVYIPVRDGARLVPEPDAGASSAKKKKKPRDANGWVPPPFFTAGIEPRSTWARGPAPPETGNGREMLKRLNRAGLGPLPGMYVPPNMAFPGVTNWPGPPDLFIVRPPKSPVTPAEIDALAAAVPAFEPSGPNPVPRPDTFTDTPPAGGVPWYRRIFGGGNKP